MKKCSLSLLGVLSLVLLALKPVAADEINIGRLAGVYDFDLEGSELTQAAHKEGVFALIELGLGGIEELGNEEKAGLIFYGAISDGAVVTDKATIEDIAWALVNGQFVDTNDEYDRTPLIIDENGVFYFVNGTDSRTEVMRQCVVTAANVHGGVQCSRERYDDDPGIMWVVENGDDIIALEISVNGRPTQRYIRRH